MDKLDPKSFYLLEKLGRSRWAGCLQSTLNKIDLSKIETENENGEKEIEEAGKGKGNSHVQYLIGPLEKSGLVTKQQYAYRFGGRPRFGTRNYFFKINFQTSKI